VPHEPDVISSALQKSLALLSSRRFGTFWVASLLANIGTWAQQVTQPWLMLSLGASPLMLGLDAFALSAPALLLTLVGGELADRADRRRTIALFQSIQMLCPLLLVAGVLGGWIQAWEVVLLSLVVGVTDALSMPSFQSIVPSIVQHEQIPAGIALNASQFNLSRILGPAVAGALMASIGMAGAFAVSAASYLPFIGVALWVLPRRLQPTLPAAPPSGQAQGSRQNLWLGVREVLAQARLRSALLTVFLNALLCAPLITFCPVLVKQAFQGDAAQFSLSAGALGLGGLLGAAALLGFDAQRDRRPWCTGFALAYAAIVVLAALNPWAEALAPLFVLAGVAMTASNASANTLLQSSAPDHLRGKTVSLFMLAMRGGLSLGSLLTGFSVHLMGVRSALALNGVLALVSLSALGLIWRRAGQPPHG
jgi:MFS family permease